MRLVPWWCSIRRGFFAVALVLLIAGALSRAGFAAEPVWRASWITHPAAPLREPIVLHFRCTLQLDGKLASVLLQIDMANGGNCGPGGGLKGRLGTQALRANLPGQGRGILLDGSCDPLLNRLDSARPDCAVGPN